MKSPRAALPSRSPPRPIALHAEMTNPSPDDHDAALSAHLLRIALREVQKTYVALNASLFDGRLRMPLLEWSRGSKHLGLWSGGTRTLSLNESLLRGPWGVLVEVLKHEMAHQFVGEVLGHRDAPPHGSLFQEVCLARGIDPRATGVPHASAGQDGSETSRVLERVRRLLALATSENQNEAEAAMSAARKLMLKHNLTDAAQKSSPYSFRHLGTPTGRRKAWQRALANILSEFFFVDIIIVPAFRPLEGKSGSVLEACGTESNLEVASYVHDFLESAAEAAWRDHKRKERLSGNRDRESYLLGVMTGFRDKLARENKALKGEGLIWLGDPELGRYLRRRHPHIRRVGGRSRTDEAAYSRGREAGERLVLRRGMSEGPSGKSPRLLTS